MKENYEDPFLDGKIDSEPSSKKKSKPKKNFWEKFTVEIELKSIKKLGIYLAGLVILVGLAWGGWTYLPEIIQDLTTKNTNIPINNTEESEITPTAKVVETTFNIPLITNPDSSAISREVKLETIIPSRERVEVIIHTVVKGDSLFIIGAQYDLDPTTILWGNREALGDDFRTISIGQELNILPVDGVYHKYKSGESLEDIADEYYVEADEIINYPGNNIDPYEFDQKKPNIRDNSWLIIPDGEADIVDWGPPTISRDNPAVAYSYGPGACGYVYEGALGELSFYWPTSSQWISGYDFNPPIHKGIDIGAYDGAPILASDHGVVVYSGWTNSTSGYGILVVVDHGGGWQTIYAHLSYTSVSCGQSVWRGDPVGGMGTTGNSSGIHLHFEISSSLYGKVNPWLYLVNTE